MSEHLPYHPSEDYQFPVTTADRILDELHYGGEGKTLRHRWTTELGRVYGGSQFAKSYAKYSSLAVDTHAHAVLIGTDQSVSGLEVASYSSARQVGGLLALHTILPTIEDRRSRQIVLRSDLHGIFFDNMSEEQIAAESLDEYDLKGLLFDNQDDDLQWSLLSAAEKLYKDYPGHIAAQQEENFLFGYLNAGFKINAILHLIGESDDKAS